VYTFMPSLSVLSFQSVCADAGNMNSSNKSKGKSLCIAGDKGYHAKIIKG